MPHLQNPRFLPSLAVIAAAALVLTGCSGAQQAAQSDEAPPRPPTVQAPRDTNQGTRYFIRGLSKTHLKAYDEAIIYYHQALKHISDSAAVFAGLAEAYSNNRDYNSAVSYAQKAVAARPGRSAYYYQLAELQKNARNISEAIAAYRHLTERFPEETRAYYAMGKLQLENGAAEAAASTFQHLIEHHGEGVRARYQLLRIYRQEDNHSGMIQTLRELIAENGSNPDLHFMLVDVYQKQGNTEAAIEVLEELRHRRPHNAEAAFRLVELYHRQGASERANSLLEETLGMDGLSADVLFDHARSLYFRPGLNRETDETVRQLLKQVLEIEADHSEALYMLGTIYLQENNYSQAFELLQRTVSNNPRNQEAWVRALLAGVNAGSYDRVLQLAEEALVLFPRHFTLFRLAGMASLRSGRHQQAADYLTRALDTSRGSNVDDEMRSSVASMLGMVYSRLNDMPRSDSLYNQAITWDQHNVTALNNYAYSLADRGVQLDKALELARRAVDLASESASFLDTLGWVYYRRGQLNRAARWIKKAVDTGDASAAVYEHYGDIQHDLGNDTKALEYWKQALEMNPDLRSIEQKIKEVRSTE